MSGVDTVQAPVRTLGSRLRSSTDRLFRPVDIASIATFRIMFGLLMLWEVWRYASRGWIGRYYLEPEFLFSYFGFGWVRPWPGDALYWHFALLGLLAVLITIGLFYRLAIIAFFFAFTYVFLLDQARYLNHFYLVSLTAFAMCFVPASRAWSLDALIMGRSRPWVPAWSLWLLLVQFEIMYIFAGIVKLNGDWLRLEPLRMWLRARSDMPLVGPLFLHDWVIAIGAYGSIAIHILGAPLLLWKRTRLPAFVLYSVFHLSNHVLFSIGIFPWLAIAGTLLFFEPDWPRRIRDKVLSLARLAYVGPARTQLPSAAAPRPLVRIAVLALLVGWAGFQTAMPLRHHLYGGNVSWHEQGHRFAWQMKLRQKRGHARFEVLDPATGAIWNVDPADHLTSRQLRYMAGRPDMILQFAHYLGARWTDEHAVADPQVRATVRTSLNGRVPALLIDPDRDLTKVVPSIGRADWILPLDEPLPARRPVHSLTASSVDRD